MKVKGFFLGGGRCGIILGLLFRRSEYGLCDISLEMDSMTPKTPDNMYHILMFYENIKTSIMYDVILLQFCL